MSTQSFKLEVSPLVGVVSAKYIVPEKPLCIFTLAHGAGEPVWIIHLWKS